MTTLCSSYGSSLSSLYFNDFMVGPMDDIYGSYIAPDPTDYFESGLPSIHDDVMKMETDNTMLCGSPNLDDLDSPLKQEIRNIDCMWSSNPQQGLLSTSAGSSFSDIVGTTTAVPLAAVTGSTQNIINNIKQEPDVQLPVVVVANNSKLLQQKRQQSKHSNIQQIHIKSEPSDDYEQKLQQHSIPNNTRTLIAQNSIFTNANTNATVQQSMQHIPPGTSLLRKSNPQQQQQQKKVKPTQSKITAAIQIPKMYTSEFLRERDQVLTANTLTTASTTTSALYVRPDTPHSLDDDEVARLTYANDISCTTPTDGNGLTTEFKHSVDLRACVIGSNNLSLTSADPTHFINHVSQELQDTSKNKIDLRFGTAGCTLNDVLDVLASNTTMKSKHLASSSSAMTACSSSSLLNGSDIDSDEESLAGSNSASSIIMDNSDDLMESYNDGSQSPVLSQASSTTMSTSSCGSSRNHRSSSNTRKHQQHYQVYMHSDHSYTRYKDGMDDLAPSLETPSDSDEEIDVVSIGDKKLPTNPSDKDRRALQTKVADKFSNARIVKNANGVRTIPPRRSISYELPYTPASNSPVKSLASSRYPSPASTPYHNQYTTKYVQQQQQMMSSTMAASSSAAAQQQTEKARKRLLGGGGSVINGIEYGLVATPTNVSCTKKSRGKKLKQQQQLYASGLGTTAATSPTSSACSTSSTSSNSSLQRHYSLDETADTIEKRNLHNDMERQRRIGLKNLFEALKKQIPSIKDKERAPKVNILREAAKLCENLTHEERLLIEQKAMLKEQMRQKKEILARLRATVQID